MMRFMTDFSHFSTEEPRFTHIILYFTIYTCIYMFYYIFLWHNRQTNSRRFVCIGMYIRHFNAGHIYIVRS